MTGQQGVRERAKPHKAAADRAAGQKKRHDATRDYDIWHRGTAAIQEGWGLGHGFNIGMGGGSGYRGF
jgi:hypothetical protein